MEKSLVEMKPGQVGVITALKGGPGFTDKLGQIGLRQGKTVKKISAMFNRGPVAVCIDNFQIAVGYGKALRIMVEVQGNEENSPGR
jgi:Fe2+ transport system protein FeoA